MTVLRHQVPSPGITVTARPYSGNKYAPVTAGNATALTAVSNAQGQASITVPDPGNRPSFWMLTRAGADPVIVRLPRGTTGTVDTAASQLGTLTPASALVDTRPAAPANLDTPGEVAAALGKLVQGRVLNSGGTAVTNKRVAFRLTADGLSLDDIVIEDAT